MPSFQHATAGATLQHSGHNFRFTIHAGPQSSEWDRVLASDPWRCMELALPAAIKDEARTYLSQGRDLFNAAHRVGMTSRPLLLYYSFMNVAKALIKIRQPTLDLRGATHGINEPETNQRAQRFRLTSQQISIQNANPNKVHVLNELASALGWPQLAPGKRFNIPVLLSQNSSNSSFLFNNQPRGRDATPNYRWRVSFQPTEPTALGFDLHQARTRIKSINATLEALLPRILLAARIRHRP